MPSQQASPDSGAAQRISDRRKLGFSLAGIIFLASLIPFANFVMPVLASSTRNKVNVEAAMESISAHENPGAMIVYGEILYPYDEDGMLTFDFLTPMGAASYMIPRTPELATELIGGEYAFLALRSDNQKNTQVESMYLWQDANPALIWKLKP
jgi:hypothetical protein